MNYENETSLRMWTIFENPSDYPGKFVVREVRAKAGRALSAVTPTAVTETLDDARIAAQAASPYVLTCMPRHEDDDPVIVEVWL